MLVFVLILPFSLDGTAIVEIITLQTVELAGSLYLFCSESKQDQDSAAGPNFFFIRYVFIDVARHVYGSTIYSTLSDFMDDQLSKISFFCIKYFLWNE